jgi:SH3-like domain-containing protein
VIHQKYPGYFNEISFKYPLLICPSYSFIGGIFYDMKRSIFFLILSLFFYTSAFSKTLSVNCEKAALMSGPGKNFQTLYEYDKGFPLKVISTKGKWVKIEDFEKDSGWIFKEFLADHPSVIVKANKNSERKINIRVGPGDTYKIIGQAFYGVVFEKLEQKNSWVKIHHDSGLTGWVQSSFLWGN